MRLVPWWALLSSGFAPVLLIGGWNLAELLQGPGYNPKTRTISVLAAYGMPGYGVMTGMLLALGACYVVTAIGLRSATLLGRAALAGGGISAMVLTLVPAPPSGGSFGHGAVVTVGFGLLAVWPVLAVDRGADAPWGLRPAAVRDGGASWGLRHDVSIAVTAMMGACAVWFLVGLQLHGLPGVAERVLTFTQALWPFLVVISCWPHQVSSEQA
ncbi:DUF998 domain-containing protein [Streptomyces sp. NPDC090052]|uniref:DUF998 domain-containing protein n=1 Tax=unclassified Streptomyces TaxID=2593676 RepID=UPI002257112A|nr:MULTISPECIES: DUF998 domain-containing protein [unclassified Streptomyces]MCX4728140.1 DUF998 domain-containing protein [Streptomyces sp. NBC_01306]WSV02635.1 DUF998 domain-containing protein [Streptomyces sp. NBC_01020]WSX40704.1 DUF998 domain-containing protein [Streptomyces sp. NBC_00963]WSX71327.1 DUF998 domain-containing protein [Streptomyces sp. NBC_00932]